MRMEQFPVAADPSVRFSRAWNATHAGTDVFAPVGTPLIAIASGKVRHAIETKGGKAVYLIDRDGTQYYYAHLDRFEGERLGPGQWRNVSAGDVIGYVGTSGNAEGKSPHLHFEVRPFGGVKADPFDFLQALSQQRGGWVSTPKPGAPTEKSSGEWAGPLVLGLLLLWGLRG